MGTTDSNSEGREWLDIVRKQVQAIRFGVVQVVVHDGRVVQIESTEKVRLDDDRLRVRNPTSTS